MYILKLPASRGRQDPRALDRALLARHPAAAGRQGAVRRPALRRDGGLGARGIRRRIHAAGDADRQVRRHDRARQGVRGDRQGREPSPSRASPKLFKVLLKEMQFWRSDAQRRLRRGHPGPELREEEDDLLRAAEELGIDLSGVRAADGSGLPDEPDRRRGDRRTRTPATAESGDGEVLEEVLARRHREPTSARPVWQPAAPGTPIPSPGSNKKEPFTL